MFLKEMGSQSKILEVLGILAALKPVFFEVIRDQDEDEIKMPTKILRDFARTTVKSVTRSGIPERVAMSTSEHKTRSISERRPGTAPG